MENRGQDRTVAALPLVVAATLLGFLLPYSHHPYSLPLLGCVIGLVMFQAVLPEKGQPVIPSRAVQAALVAAIIGCIIWLSLTDVWVNASKPIFSYKIVLCLAFMGLASMASLAFKSGRGGLLLAQGAIVSVFFAVIAVQLVWINKPFMDVYTIQTEGADAFLQGRNPYAGFFNNIYGAGTGFYSRELLAPDGRVSFYPYAPLTILLSSAGKIFGDVRYCYLAVMAASMLLMSLMSGGGIGVLAGCALLLTPFSFAMFNNAWTEPIVVMTLALLVLFAGRGSRLAPYALGLFLSSKQYCIIALPLTVLLLPRPLKAGGTAVFYLKAFLTAAAVNLPFFIWGPHDFWADVVVAQAVQPYRGDSLSFLVPMVNKMHVRPSVVWGFLAAVPATLAAMWRAPRNPSGFAWSVAFVFLVFFAFSKQACVNYYYFIVGAMLISVAASGDDRGAREVSG